MEDKNSKSWETFKRTGHIEAYLLYKSAAQESGEGEKDNTWQELEQEVLS